MSTSTTDGMETLAPRAAYDTDELGITERLPLYSGVFYGVGMGLFAVVQGMVEGQSLGRVIFWAIFAALFGGIFFGLAFPLAMMGGARRINDRLYAGDPRMVPPTPAGRYTHRLPCGWMHSPRRIVGGVLYLGATGLRFDPHLRNRARDREGFVMEPLEGVTVHRVDARLPWWFRVWGHRTAPRIQVRWGSDRVAQFGVPDTAAVFARLQETIAGLQHRNRDASA